MASRQSRKKDQAGSVKPPLNSQAGAETGAGAGAEARAGAELLGKLPGGFITYEAGGEYKILAADAGVLKLLGCADFAELQALAAGGFLSLVHPADRDDAFRIISSGGAQGALDGTFRLVDGDGHSLRVQDYHHLKTAGGSGQCCADYLLSLSTLTGAENLTDGLTGLDGMMTFFNKVNRICAGLDARERAEYALAYFDVVNFKAFNRRAGFDQGSLFLCFVARTLEAMYPQCPVSRLADDHFAVFAQAEALRTGVKRLQDKVYDFSAEVRLELKTGIYCLEGENETASAICDNARQACENAKQSFAVNVSYFDESLREKHNLRRYIVEHFETALEDGTIQVYYQPVVRIVSGNICCVEALSRWDDPVRGLLHPDDYLAVLEQCHLIHKLDLLVISRVCEDFDRLRSENAATVPCSVNVSKVTFETCDIVREFEDIVRQHNVPRSCINIEVSECDISQDDSAMVRAMTAFGQMGYGLWMDSFGSGYSSLNLLKDFSFSLIKFGMSFLHDFAVPAKAVKAREILSSTVNMAKRLGMQTLTVGVENRDQLEFLRSIGCEKAQGFLFSKPLPPNCIDDFKDRFEDPSDAFYYDSLGRVHLVNHPALDGASGSFADAKAMAVIERRGDGSFRMLQCNDACTDFLRSVNFYRQEDFENFMNHGRGGLHERLLVLFEHCYTHHAEQILDFVSNGEYCNLRLRFIAENAQNHNALFMALAVNFSRYSSQPKHEHFERCMSGMFKLFEHVDLIDVDDQVVETVYKGDDSRPGSVSKIGLARGVAMYAERVVASQQERFMKFMDFETLGRRTNDRNRNSVSALFRMRGPDGSYTLKVVVLVPLEIDGRRMAIACRADAEPLSMSGFSLDEAAESAAGALRSGELWSSLLDSPDDCLYWKNAERRIEGMNGAFAAFFGLDGISSVAGKTDEDLGWFVEGAGNRQSDEEVLRTGAHVTMQGQCLVQGVIRDIEIRKLPVIREGRVAGLICRLSVPQLRESAVSFTDTASFKDVSTGVLDLGGLHEALIRYEYAFASDRKDFIMMRFSCENSAQFKQDNGRAYFRQTEKQLMNSVLDLVGNSGAVAKTGDMSGVILKQVGGPEEQQELRRGLEKLVSDLHDKDGNYSVVRMQIECYSYKDRQGSKRIRELFN